MPIGEAFAFNHGNGGNHSRAVCQFARVPSKGKLVRVLLKMLAADVMPCPKDTAFKQAEKGFAMVCAGGHAIGLFQRVFKLGMDNLMMRLERFGRLAIASVFIGANHSLFADAFIQCLSK